MPNIQVEISSKSEGSKKITTEIQSNSLPDLIASLKKSKAEINSVLTEIVEKRKSLDVKRSTNEDEDSDENDEDDDSSATNKKQKT